MAASVFEHMCTSEPQVRARLRPCGRRLVSADSSPLSVKGEIELTIVFPGLSCDMLLVVANIDSDGLLGTEALQSCLPHQLDLRTGQLWVEGRSTLQLHQQRLAPNVKAFLRTSVVLPPDSEIIAPISVWSPSGILPGYCSLVEPSGRLTEDYGVVVGRTLVYASSWSASVLMVNPNCGGDCSAQFHICRRLSYSVGCFGGSCGSGAARGRVRDLTESSGGHCHGISPFFGGGWS